MCVPVCVCVCACACVCVRACARLCARVFVCVLSGGDNIYESLESGSREGVCSQDA